MNPKNKIIIFLLLFSFILGILGAFLRINKYDYANILLLVSILGHFTAVIGLFIVNFRKIKALLG